MSKYQHKFSDSVSEGVMLQGQEVWRPAIAHPYYTTKGLPFWKRPFEKYWRPQCGCGQIFETKQAHDEHYIYYAVWQNESGYIPQQIQSAVDAERLKL